MLRIDRVAREQVTAAFLEAFSDYILDVSSLTEERLEVRWVKNNVDWETSVGAFDGERMVGFTLIGVDQWQGCLAAFDAATGIVQGYRGQGLASEMFDHALPKLDAMGIESFVLEVIADNQPAIRAYEKAGFTIHRRLKCFELDLSAGARGTDAACPFPIRPIERQVVQSLAAEADTSPSWENSFAAIERIPDDLISLGAFDGDRCVGVTVYSPAMDWVMNLVVRGAYRRQGVGSALVEHLCRATPQPISSLRLPNLDAANDGMIEFLEERGFRHTLDQFEMVRAI